MDMPTNHVGLISSTTTLSATSKNIRNFEKMSDVEKSLYSLFLLMTNSVPQKLLDFRGRPSKAASTNRLKEQNEHVIDEVDKRTLLDISKKLENSS